MTECVKEIIVNKKDKEVKVYGVPGSSGSQEAPIVVSSDAEIKEEKPDDAATSKKGKEKSRDKRKRSGETATKKKRKGKSTKCDIKGKGKARAVSYDSSSSSSSSSDSNNSNKGFVPNFFFRKDDMPKHLRESLRVNKCYLSSSNSKNRPNLQCLFLSIFAIFCNSTYISYFSILTDSIIYFI